MRSLARAGMLLAALAIYALFMVLTVPAVRAVVGTVNLPSAADAAAGCSSRSPFVAPAVAIGLFISAIAGSGRDAIFLFGVVLVVTVGVQSGYSALQGLAPKARTTMRCSFCGRCCAPPRCVAVDLTAGAAVRKGWTHRYGPIGAIWSPRP